MAKREMYLGLFIDIIVLIDIFNMLFIDNMTLFILFTCIYIIEYSYFVINYKKKYILSYRGLYDIILLLSSFIGEIRVLRVFRFIRVIKKGRINKLLIYLGLGKIVEATRKSRHEIIIFGKTVVILFLISAIVIYIFEHNAQPESFANIWDGIWWSFTTMTTVGYGDIYPITVMGRLFAMIVTFLGLGIVSIPSGIIAATLVEMSNDTKEFNVEEALNANKKLFNDKIIDNNQYQKNKQLILKKFEK